MISLWVTIAAPAIYLLISSIISFITNLRGAQKTGLPIVISPVDHLNPVWVALQKPLGPLVAKLPFGLGSWVRYNRLSWFFDDKYHMHEEHGKVFIHVTPGMNELHSIDPEVNLQILARRKDFEKPDKILKAVTVYGDSISSMTGSEWQRHRRITAPPFNERNCRLVWDESLNQASQLASYWSARGSGGISSLTKDIMTMALNVLATSALGRSWRFHGAEEGEGQASEEADSMVYRNTLACLLRSIRFLVLTPLWVYSLPLALLPGELRNHVSAYREFRQYMAAMIKEKKAEVAAGHVSDDTFLNTIVSKSEEFRKQGKASVDGVSVSGGLSDDELFGNLFTYNFAGHETTAGSVCFALYLLAVYPHVQEWAREEILCVYEQCAGPDGTSPPYEAAFPRLKRCLAVMYETLRLYNPVNSVNKATIGPRGQELVIDGQSVLIPPNTMTAPNVIGSGTFPEYWGKDHLEWKPDRWIEPPGQSQDMKIQDFLNQEDLVLPSKAKGAFIPWSGGARVCPGKKFSRVEFVAVISTLLRSYKIEVVPREGETEAQARERCFEVVKDSETQVTLQMRNPGSVNVRLDRL